MSLEKRTKCYKAHFDESKGKIQTIKEHSYNTANIAMSFSIPELQELIYYISLLHDIGKYTQEFQELINGKHIKVEHSTCGGIEAFNSFNSSIIGIWTALCIIGHHTGLPDCGSPNDKSDNAKTTMYGRLGRTFSDYAAYKNEISLPNLNIEKINNFLKKDCSTKEDLIDKFAFFVRYAFSCLTDADSLDTEMFYTETERNLLKSNFTICLNSLNKQLLRFEAKTKLQCSRAKLQKQAFDKVDIDANVYLLDMPTGSGKTLCGAKFALERAILKSKKRIIYVIPYNSIIDQTADTFDDIFGENANILRHQSTFSVEDYCARTGKNIEDYKTLVKLSTENWDAEFIITTMVQFFESIYSNTRSKLRKLHNMGNSIILFDEIHMMPYAYLQPCLEAINYITKYLNSEAIFLTATMPDFTNLFQKYSLPNLKIVNLIDDKSYFADFKKCSFIDKGKISEESLLEHSNINRSSLIIVNNRKEAKLLYQMASGKKYHLSTYMTTYDRRRVIKEIKNSLNQLNNKYGNSNEIPESDRILVISTSLIEAGVDLDFYAVYREITGLEHILQASGRCNREGIYTNAYTYIFEFEKKCLSDQIDTEITRGLLFKYSDSIDSSDSINMYYKNLMSLNKEKITKNSMYQFCEKPNLIPFKEYADKFDTIDSKTMSIVVPRDAFSRSLIDLLSKGFRVSSMELQNYSCNVYLNEFNTLFEQGVLEDYDSGNYCLTNPDYYDNGLGICFEGKDYIL